MENRQSRGEMAEGNEFSRAEGECQRWPVDGERVGAASEQKNAIGRFESSARHVFRFPPRGLLLCGGPASPVSRV